MFDSTVLEYSRCAYTLLYLIKNSYWIMISTSYPIVPEFAGYHPDRPHIHNITTKKCKILILEFKSLSPSFKMLVNFFTFAPTKHFFEITKEFSFCNKLEFSNHNIFATLWCKPLIFQTQVFWSSRMHSLKYLRSTTLGCKDIGILKS